MIRIAHILGKMNGSDADKAVLSYYSAIDRDRVQFDLYIAKGSTHIPVEDIKAMGGGIYVLPSLKKGSAFVKSLKKLLTDNAYDIVHCHTDSIAPTVLKTAKQCGVRTRIFHCHTERLSALKKAAAKRYATHWLADSDYAARKVYGAVPICSLTDIRPPVKHAIVVPYAVSIKKYGFDQKKRSELRGEFKLPSKTLVFGYTGTLTKQDEQGFLIDVFKQIIKKHKNSALIVVGNGKYKELLQARVITAELNGKVIFAGEREDSDKLYSGFDCLLVPSKLGGFPAAAVEAQCAGLYCLFSDKLSKEVKLTDSAQFLSLKSSAEDWACAALCFAKLRNHKAAEQLTAAGYDAAAAANELESFYLSL